MTRATLNPSNPTCEYFKKTMRIVRQGALAIFLAGAGTASAQLLMSVDSTTDGNGLFTYTFSAARSDYIFGVSPGGGIVLQSHGILDVSSPAGWTATINPDETIQWSVLSGVAFIGEPPVTVSVRSSFTGVATYDQLFGSGDTYQAGIVVGGAYTLPDHAIFLGGYERFNYLGPQVIPEPSGLAILAFGTGLVATVRKASSRRTNQPR